MVSAETQVESMACDTGKMTTEQIAQIYGAFSRMESTNHSNNMRFSVRMRMEKGLFVPPTAPYGYRLVGWDLEIVSDEAEIVRHMFRVKGVSWWPEELPSDEEYEEAVRNLERVNWRVDCVLTHCAPTSIQKKLDRSYTPDRLTDFLQMVKRRCQFDYWFLGHYHRNCVVDDRFIIQWEQMVELQWE